MRSSEFPTADRQPPQTVQTCLTVLLPRLSGWIQQLAPADRFPTLETLLARADTGPPLADQLNPLRMKLFGLDGEGEVPVAALSRFAAGRLCRGDSTYWLRMDPAVLQADLYRVRLMHTGFGGFPAPYQQQVRQIVEQAVEQAMEHTGAAEGAASAALALEADDQGWILSLNADPGLQFASVDDAMGADISDCLPDGIAAQYWKKLQNDIQMALHASLANQSRRRAGEAVINSVWFWGGGKLPAAGASRGFDQVYSQDPVSSGLARLYGSGLKPLNELAADGSVFTGDMPGRTLVDWAIPVADAEAAALACTPERLEAFCAGALAQLQRRGGLLEIRSPEKSWRLQAWQLWRIWRRPRPLVQQLSAQLNPPVRQP